MKNILVIRLGSIGDVVLASAPVINLKLSFSDSRIYFLTREQNAPLVRMMTGVDEVIALPRKISLLELFRTGEFFDKLGIDIICDLHGNFRSKYWMRHIAASVKAHYPKRRRERLLAVRLHRIDPIAPHTIDLYNAAVTDCGGDVYTRRPSLRLPRPYRSVDRKPIVAIAPGASYPTKQWPQERFKKLISELQDRGIADIFLLLTDNDKTIFESGSRQESSGTFIKINTPLPEVAAGIAAADLLLCNDSGLMHIGSAVGTPVLALFGPTHPTLGFAPRGWHDEIIQVEEPCRPCSLHGKKLCFRDKQYCFDRIEVDFVKAKVIDGLNKNAKNRPALFIDRDGTLIKEKGFLSDPEQVEPEEKSIEAIRMARSGGFKIIILSNQSGVARGYFGLEQVDRVNDRIRSLFAEQKAELDDILYCPYYELGTVKPFAQKSFMRKPAAGMIERAVKAHGINPFASYCIGDKLSDVRLAYSTGGRGILVRTGYGQDSVNRLTASDSFAPETITDNLFEAVKYIMTDIGTRL